METEIIPANEKEVLEEETNNSPAVGIDTPSLDTPKSNVKKQRTRTNSESSTPNATKMSQIAKMSPRATRSSQNPDFAAKQRKFLNRVHDPIRRDNSDNENNPESINTPTSSKSLKENKLKSMDRRSVSDLKRKSEKDSFQTPKRSAETDEEGSSKKRRTKEPTKVVGGVDSYCWRCHRDGSVIPCEICPRVYHLKCVQMEAAPPKGWMCPECSTVTQAENTDTRSRSMRMLTLDQLCNLLRFALNRMKNYEGSEDFAKPVDVTAFPQYRDFIVKPMDLMQLKQNIKAKMYGSTEAFLADAKWIVHNSIIFNSVQSKFTNTARALLKICRQEMQEIENCPDCYQNAHTRSSDSWFIEACRRPHVLVWAKLKGFPFWPAKAMTTNNENLVDVRFFGAHDRAWVPVSSCFLYSKLSPAPASNKSRRNLEECLQELEYHIKKLRDKFGRFEYPPYKTPYDPNNDDAQLAMFLPMYEAKVPGKRMMRISLHHDGARKSLLQQKPSSAEKTAKEDNTAETVLPTSKESSPIDKQASNDLPSPLKTLVPPMVSFPSKSKSNTETSDPEIASSEDEVEKSGTTQGIKKSYKIPLTAAAKKCFATKDKCCVRCQTQSAESFHQNQNGDLFCASCHAKETEKPQTQAKSCAVCDTHIAMSWLHNSAGLTLCSSCGFAEQLLKKNENPGDPSATVRGTVTIQRKREALFCDERIDDSEIRENEILSSDISSASNIERSTSAVAVIDDQAGGDKPSADVDDGVQQKPSASGDTPELDFAAVDSPPKFIITKANGTHSPETSKKVSIVDRLQEKLCFAVEEAIKDHLTVEDKNETETTSEEKEEEVILEKSSNEETLTTKEMPLVKVMLHDLNSSIINTDKTGRNDKTQNENKMSKETDLEINSSSDISSEPETDASSSIESDGCVNNEENTKKKKQNNINNVVRTLQERKNSVDESNDQNNKSSNINDSNTVLLDDSNDEVPVLIIDEGEDHSSETKKSSVKSDKNRRKGIPAKVFNRSSTSTESSEMSSPDEQSKTSKAGREVLDEVSGQFRRLSGESNVTITLVTDEAAPHKKSKEIRSVNISKSLSLSVINDSSSGLEMDCTGSDLDDQMIVDAITKKVNPRPTARKTLPNPPRAIELPNLQEKSNPCNQSKEGEPEAVKLRQAQPLINPSTPPPPLINLRQTKVYGPPKIQNGSSPAAPRLHAVKPPSTPTPRAELGPANAQLEEAVSKMTGQLRIMLEDMLRGMSEAGATEATVKAMQVEMERLQWRHRQEIAELKHNTDLLVMEIRASLEAEKQRALLDVKHKHEIDKEQAVQETKRKQWCAFCLKEAQLYCCWNTAYCSYNCQQSHWMPHMTSCLNKQQGNNNSQEVSPRGGLPRPTYLPSGQVGYLINS